MYQPIVPTGGLVGWRFLERTLDTQIDAYAKSDAIERSMEYFRERIGTIETPEALVADRRLLTVALEAFGLGEDIDAKFLIRRVLEEGTSANDALANRLSDKRYREFSDAFGFAGFGGPKTRLPGFADRIADRFVEQSFEAAVGEQNEALRLALNARTALAEVAANSGSDDVAWFNIMGTPPLRAVMEGALGLPQGIGVLDLDRQLGEFRARAQSAFGTSDVSELAQPDVLERVIDRYLIRDSAANAPPTSPALMLLRGF